MLPSEREQRGKSVEPIGFGLTGGRRAYVADFEEFLADVEELIHIMLDQYGHQPGKKPLAAGRCVYGAFLDDQGRCIDDAIVFFIDRFSWKGGW